MPTIVKYTTSEGGTILPCKIPIPDDRNLTVHSLCALLGYQMVEFEDGRQFDTIDGFRSWVKPKEHEEAKDREPEEVLDTLCLDMADVRSKLSQQTEENGKLHARINCLETRIENMEKELHYREYYNINTKVKQC